MNGLTLIVLIVILLCAFRGYRMGFLRVVYSLSSWILVLAFVTWATPYITEFIIEKTPLQGVIEEKCFVFLEDSAEKYMEQEAEEQTQQGVNDLSGLGLHLPSSVLDNMTRNAADITDGILEESGIYNQLSIAVTNFIIEGIAFFAALIIAGIFAKYILGLLNLVSRLPVLHGINKFLGVFAGLLKGIMIIWLAFYLFSLFCTNEAGQIFMSYIRESPILSNLYENNLLLKVLMRFL